MPLFESPAALLDAARAIAPWIVDVRRRLHQCPELQYELHETSGIVRDELTRLGVEFEAGLAETGVAARIGTNASRCLLLRADMDALPIEEQTDVEFRSRNAGRMHACGHDCHTAMLLGAARLLKEREADLPGVVKLCFQPAEEGGAGGKRMCDEGVMQNPRVEKAFALHMWPMIPTGHLTGRPGPFLAATNAFEIHVTGKGGHAAMPHFARDPIVAASQIVVALQTLVSREQDPLEAGVVSVTAVNGGAAYNVIPAEVTLKGTIRSLSTERRDHLKDRVRDVAAGIAAVFGCEARFVSIGEDYPETSNDPELWRHVHAMGERLVGEGNFPVCEPLMGGEDFAYYGAHAPTCFVAVGCRNADDDCTFGLHHPRFKVDEAALPLGTALHLAFVDEHFA